MDKSFQIVTFFTPEYALISAATGRVAEQYARRYGHAFHRLFLDGDSIRRHVYWQKIQILNEYIDRADFTLWIDADVLIVGNGSLENIVMGSEITVSQDINGACCGVMLLHNSQWTKMFLRAWSEFGVVDSGMVSFYERRNLQDQTAFKCLVANFPNVRARVRFWPEATIQNPRSIFATSAFMMHFWASSGNFGRILRAVEYFEVNGWNGHCFRHCIGC